MCDNQPVQSLTCYVFRYHRNKVEIALLSYSTCHIFVSRCSGVRNHPAPRCEILSTIERKSRPASMDDSTKCLCFLRTYLSCAVISRQQHVTCEQQRIRLYYVQSQRGVRVVRTASVKHICGERSSSRFRGDRCTSCM